MIDSKKERPKTKLGQDHVVAALHSETPLKPKQIQLESINERLKGMHRTPKSKYWNHPKLLLA